MPLKSTFTRMLLRIFLLCSVFSIGNFVYAQLNADYLVPLKCSGEIPVSLRESCQFLLFDNTQTPYLSIGKTTDSEIQSVYKNLASTGKLLFGDVTHASCREILDRLIKADPEITQQVEIYAFKKINIHYKCKSTINPYPLFNVK